MSTLSTSPKSGSFQKDNLTKRVENGETTLQDVEPLFELYKSMEQQQRELEQTDEWKTDNLEYDLRSTEWILTKVRSSDIYAQNLYAAMCNRDFVKNQVVPILKDKRWSCSWRYAGRIVSHMQEKGDYIDWYCSGIRDTTRSLSDSDWGDLPKEQQEYHLQSNYFVNEGVVTDEIRQDLLKLGWIVVDEMDQLI